MQVNFSSEVLTIGPPLKGKGGISYLIHCYNIYISGFRVFATFSGYSKPLEILLFPFRLCRFALLLLFNKQIKIIHIHGASRGSFIRKYSYFLISKYIFEKKIVYHIHGAEYHLFYENSPAFLKTLIKHFIEKADTIIALSENWKTFFTDNFNAKKVIIIPNISHSVEKKEKKIAQEEKVYFLFLGRIGQRKGIYDILETLHENKTLFENNMKLIIGGDGETENLKKLIASYGLKNMVEFHGWINEEAKIKLLNQCHIFILPSYNEGLPLAILEAMSHTMPVISTPVGGIPEVVFNNKNGILISPGNKEQLCSAMRFFINNKEKISEYGNESYSIVSANHFPEPVINKLHSLYTEILSK